MKAKLIKKDDIFYLYVDESWAIASTDSRDNRDKKLSKQNCDELFGVVDVEKLATQHLIDKNCASLHTSWQGYNENTYKEGFNKAMELNKDKVFTLEDMLKAIQFGEDNTDIESFDDMPEEDKLQFIQSLQQPTEIEVEIVTETINDGLDEMAQPQYAKVPKLDSEGQLILKKK
jgi:hypothetical protein